MGYDIGQSSRSGKSGGQARSGRSNENARSGHLNGVNNSGGMPNLKSRPRKFRDDSQDGNIEVNKFQPKKFKEEDSFAAMQKTQLRQNRDLSRKRHSR